jgi:hypothetical protein
MKVQVFNLVFPVFSMQVLTGQVFITGPQQVC